MGENISVQVTHKGLVQAAVPAGRTEVVLPKGSKAIDLLSLLSNEHGPRYAQAIFSPRGNLLPTVAVLINGQRAINLREAEINAGAEITVVVQAYR